jgi:hypothetical protein
MTFDLQTILVQDQTFHLYNHAQEVIQLLALKYVQLTISLLGIGEDLRTCCLNVSSLGGSLTKVEYLTVSNFTRNLFRSIWHRFDFPFGSISKPAVGSPLEHGCKDGKFGLEPILFEGQMSSDFLQDLVCNGRSVYSKGCVCFEQNLSCTELCPCQALDLCHNVITHGTDIEDDDG